MLQNQQFTIIGNLGRDAELRESAHGDFLSFSVAANRKTGGAEDRQDVVLWANIVDPSPNDFKVDTLKKGQLVLVQGYLRSDANGNPPTFVDNNGETRSKFLITATTVQVLRTALNGTAPVQDAPSSDIPF